MGPVNNAPVRHTRAVPLDIVTATGEYDPGEQVLVGGRHIEGTEAAVVVTALHLELEDGSDGVDLADQPITLGRGADQRLRIKDTRASRAHAVVRRRSKGRDGWEVEDQGSANGTELNGHRIPDGRVAPLRDGDRIGIGSAIVVYSEGGGAPPLSGSSSDPEATRIAP